MASPNGVTRVNVSAIVLVEGEVLTVRRSPYSARPATWEVPGGRVDFGEDPTAAVERELGEETGLSCTPGPVIGVRSTVNNDKALPVHKVELFYFFDGCRGGEVTLSEEHDRYRWVPIDQLPDSVPDEIVAWLTENEERTADQPSAVT